MRTNPQSTAAMTALATSSRRCPGTPLSVRSSPIHSTPASSSGSIRRTVRRTTSPPATPTSAPPSARASITTRNNRPGIREATAIAVRRRATAGRSRAANICKYLHDARPPQQMARLYDYPVALRVPSISRPLNFSNPVNLASRSRARSYAVRHALRSIVKSPKARLPKAASRPRCVGSLAHRGCMRRPSSSL